MRKSEVPCDDDEHWTVRAFRSPDKEMQELEENLEREGEIVERESLEWRERALWKMQVRGEEA